jgi:hypothetical protein
MPLDETTPITTDPMETAKANGYVEPEPMSRDERVSQLLAHVDHVHQHNSPMSLHFIGELKALLQPVSGA